MSDAAHTSGTKRACCVWPWLFLPAVLLGLATGCGRVSSPDVVVYAAQDQVYAEPLLAEFTKETGIRVRPVFDSEAAKTVGLANRLLAERDHPVCDVFWGNEELRVRQLEFRGVWRETNGWAAVGWRSRRLMVNTNFLPLAQAPGSLRDLTNAQWRGKVALAYPLFGTTATQFLALRQHWGEEVFDTWCRALVANRALVVDGNSVVARLVARGEAWIGLTDSDDIDAVKREGAPVVALPLTADSLLIPNAIAVTRGAPRAAKAEKLYQWLRRPATVKRLVELGALEGAEPGEAGVKSLQPDWVKLVAELEPNTTRLKEMFLR
jgi:iron(III) transport system substrate-binding protein